MLETPKEMADFLLKVLTTPLDVPSPEREALIKETDQLIQGLMIPMQSDMKEVTKRMRPHREEIAKAVKKGVPLQHFHARFQREMYPEFERKSAEESQRLREVALAGFLDEAELQINQRRASQAFLEEIRIQAQPLLDILEKGWTSIGPRMQVFFYLTSQGIEEQITPTETGSWVFAYLILPLLRCRPFPFGLCAVCRRMFVQAQRGKPRRYCSAACRMKGMPSAAKRTWYMLTQRRKKRAQEIEQAKQILRTVPHDVEQQLRALEQAFPLKSRRQRLHLIKCTQRKSKEGSHGRISQERKLVD